MSVEMLELEEGKIKAYNVPKGCCVHAYCDCHASYYYRVKVGGMELHLVFCRKHYEQFWNQLWKIKNTNSKNEKIYGGEK
jgi:hypothetical protein